VQTVGVEEAKATVRPELAVAERGIVVVAYSVPVMAGKVMVWGMVPGRVTFRTLWLQPSAINRSPAASKAMPFAPQSWATVAELLSPGYSESIPE